MVITPTARMASRSGTTARSASRSSASATAPRRWSRACSSTRMPRTIEFVPGLMHVNLGGYHIRDIEFTAAFDIDVDKVGKDLSEAIFAEPEQHHQVRRRAEPRRHGPSRHDPRRPGQVPLARSSPRRPARPPISSRILKDTETDVVISYLPVGSRDGDQVVCRAGAGSRLRLRQLHPGLHRQRRNTGERASRSAACRSSATTSRARSARRSPTAC